MDTLTHTLTGAVIAKAINDERIGHWGTLTGLAMGVFPDTDFVLGLFNYQFYLQYHRDFTHSLILIPFYSFFFSWVFTKISKRPHFWSFFKISLLVLISHVLLDLLTSYDTMVFSPFFEKRFSWDLVFIIDLIFSGIIIIPWVVSLFLKRESPWICRGILMTLMIYILFCWVQHEKAMRIAGDFSKKLGKGVVQIAALPQPASPFRWSIYVETQDKVYQGFVDLKGSEISQNSLYLGTYLKQLSFLYNLPDKVQFRSVEKLPNSFWVKKALTASGVQFYYWFARFPVVKSIDSNEKRHRVEFMDMRFYIPYFRLPFVYYVELDESGKVIREGFVRDRKRK
ncbi:MAG: metal-dependent hydrolase [Thermodesulfobacteriota bacterium]